MIFFFGVLVVLVTTFGVGFEQAEKYHDVKEPVIYEVVYEEQEVKK